MTDGLFVRQVIVHVDVTLSRILFVKTNLAVANLVNPFKYYITHS